MSKDAHYLVQIVMSNDSLWFTVYYYLIVHIIYVDLYILKALYVVIHSFVKTHSIRLFFLIVGSLLGHILVNLNL